VLRSPSDNGGVYVCDECVSEEALKDFIRNAAVAETCDFCGRESDEPIACDFDEFKEVFEAGIAVDWDDALNFMPREGGGWALEEVHRDIYDLIADGELDVELSPALFDRIVQEFIDTSYAPRYYFDLAPEEALFYGWQAFVHHVSHRTRFFFAIGAGEEDQDDREISPAEMMSALGRVVAERGLVRALAAGTELFRGRLHHRGDPPPVGAKELGAPPLQFARVSNRMSPNGIPMFYAAFDEPTAIAETVAPGRSPADDLTIGVFRTHAALQIVDLVDPPPPPSRYADDVDNARPALRFLRGFVEEVRRPIVRDEREHLEYVPTQIVTEYFRHIYEREHGERVDGISYRSAARPEGASIVLFAENGDCVDTGPTLPTRQLVLTRQYSIV
jgi:hypothetical protein